MSRHVADRSPEPDPGARLVRFLRLARAERMHPAIRALHARRPSQPAQGRLRPFLRILRGRTA